MSWDIVHPFAVVPVERWPYPWPRPEVRHAPVTVVGELCTTEDTLVRDMTVDTVLAGDLVVFPDVALDPTPGAEALTAVRSRAAAPSR